MKKVRGKIYKMRRTQAPPDLRGLPSRTVLLLRTPTVRGKLDHLLLTTPRGVGLMGSSPNDFSSPCDTNNYADVAPIATTFRRRGGVERLCIYSETDFFVFSRCEDRNEITATMRT